MLIQKYNEMLHERIKHYENFKGLVFPKSEELIDKGRAQALKDSLDVTTYNSATCKKFEQTINQYDDQLREGNRNFTSLDSDQQTHIIYLMGYVNGLREAYSLLNTCAHHYPKT